MNNEWNMLSPDFWKYLDPRNIDNWTGKAQTGTNQVAKQNITLDFSQIGITQEDLNLLAVLGVLILLAAFGGWFGQIGYWGMITLGVIALVAYFANHPPQRK